MIEEIPPQQAHDLQKTGEALLIDVREKEEIEGGIVTGALWFPTSQMGDPQEPEKESKEWLKFKTDLPREKTLVLYCASGMRSGQVGAFLNSQGYQCKNMGGYSDWVASQLPVQTPELL